MQIKKDIMWRVILVYVFICLFGIAIITKVALIQFKEGDKLGNQESPTGLLCAFDHSRQCPAHELRRQLPRPNHHRDSGQRH